LPKCSQAQRIADHAIRLGLLDCHITVVPMERLFRSEAGASMRPASNDQTQATGRPSWARKGESLRTTSCGGLWLSAARAFVYASARAISCIRAGLDASDMSGEVTPAMRLARESTDQTPIRALWPYHE